MQVLVLDVAIDDLGAFEHQDRACHHWDQGKLMGKYTGISYVNYGKIYMGVSIVMGVPNSWMVDFMENPNLQMDDLGVPLFQETTIWKYGDFMGISWVNGLM